jgi:hypothetical protein
MNVQFPGGQVVQFPDGTPDSTIKRVASTFEAPSDATGGQKPAPNMNREWARAGVNALPMAGGMAGGLIGGAGGTVAGFGVGGYPGGVAGAAAGGAGGEAIRQNLIRAFPALEMEAPATAGEAAGGIGREAFNQGAMEAGGRVLAGGVRLVGKGLMRAAIRPTQTLRGKFPRIIDTAIGEGRIPMREAMRDGLKNALATNRSRLMGMSKEMNVALDEALAKGNWYSPDEFLATVEGSLKGSAKDNPLRIRYMNRLRSMVNEFRRGRRGPMIPEVKPSTMVDAQGNPLIPGSPARPVFPEGEPMSPRGVRRMKRAGQRSASYIAGPKGEAGAGITRQMEGEFQKAVAGDARANLAKLPTGAPGENVAGLDQRMQELIGLRQALFDASNRHYGSGLPMLPPAINWAMPAGLRSPEVLYPTALGMTNPALKPWLTQTPRTLLELMQLLPLIGSSPEQEVVK